MERIDIVDVKLPTENGDWVCDAPINGIPYKHANYINRGGNVYVSITLEPMPQVMCEAVHAPAGSRAFHVIVIVTHSAKEGALENVIHELGLTDYWMGEDPSADAGLGRVHHIYASLNNIGKVTPAYTVTNRSKVLS